MSVCVYEYIYIYICACEVWIDCGFESFYFCKCKNIFSTDTYFKFSIKFSGILKENILIDPKFPIDPFFNGSRETTLKQHQRSVQCTSVIRARLKIRKNISPQRILENKPGSQRIYMSRDIVCRYKDYNLQK